MGETVGDLGGVVVFVAVLGEGVKTKDVAIAVVVGGVVGAAVGEAVVVDALKDKSCGTAEDALVRDVTGKMDGRFT